MRIDLNRIPRDRPCAVHIPTPEHGQVFLDEMSIYFPSAVRSWTKAHFENWRQNEGGNYYFPRLNQENPFMTHGTADVYLDMGVELMSFDDIIVPDIELDTVLGDMSIESLFDAG